MLVEDPYQGMGLGITTERLRARVDKSMMRPGHCRADAKAFSGGWYESPFTFILQDFAPYVATGSHTGMLAAMPISPLSAVMNSGTSNAWDFVR